MGFRSIIQITLILCSFIESYASSRILRTSYDLSKPISINMEPGKATSVTLPCKIADIFSGASAGLQKSLSSENPRRVALRIDSYVSKSTNIIFHCDETEEIILLDVKNRAPHQDVIIISSTFGTPGSNFEKVKEKPQVRGQLLESSRDK